MPCKHLLFLCLLPFGLILGCGPAGPAVQPVSGTVTLDGQPVEGATISFVPLEDPGASDLSGPLLAIGRTDASGKYALTATQSTAVDRGTTVGQYKVTIVKKNMANAPTGPPPAGQRFVPRYEYHVPQAFEGGIAGPSPIEVEVVRGRNVFNFSLKSDGTFEMTK